MTALARDAELAHVGVSHPRHQPRSSASRGCATAMEFSTSLRGFRAGITGRVDTDKLDKDWGFPVERQPAAKHLRERRQIRRGWPPRAVRTVKVTAGAPG